MLKTARLTISATLTASRCAMPLRILHKGKPCGRQALTYGQIVWQPTPDSKLAPELFIDKKLKRKQTDLKGSLSFGMPSGCLRDAFGIPSGWKRQGGTGSFGSHLCFFWPSSCIFFLARSTFFDTFVPTRHQGSLKHLKNMSSLLCFQKLSFTFAPDFDGQVLYGQLLENPPGWEHSKGIRL